MPMSAILRPKFRTAALFRANALYARAYTPIAAKYEKTAEEAVSDILYNIPERKIKKDVHVLNCFVNNEPGILSKVSGVMAARGYNIDSLVVSNSEVPALSRMTITLRGASTIIEQARKQLEDLNQVLAVIDLTKSQVIERDVLLIKVSTANSPNSVKYRENDGEYTVLGESALQPNSVKMGGFHTTSENLNKIKVLADIFKAKIVDVGIDSVMIEMVSESYTVETFYQLLVPFGIIEASRTGRIVMSKIPRNFPVGKDSEDTPSKRVDISELPPS